MGYSDSFRHLWIQSQLLEFSNLNGTIKDNGNDSEFIFMSFQLLKVTAILTLLILNGCRTHLAGQIQLNSIADIPYTIKPAPEIDIWAVTIRQEEAGKLYISGRLKMRGVYEGPSYGHVIISLMNKDNLLKSEHHIRSSPYNISKRHPAYFSTYLPIGLQAGEYIQIAYTGESMAQYEHRMKNDKR